MQKNILELEKKPDEEYQRLIEEQTELEACSQSPLYFLQKYGKIRDKIRGIIPWEAWVHLVYLIDCLHKYRFIVLLKTKQMGFTWAMAGDNLHLASFVEGANILTLSKGEDEATESLDYSRFMHNQLPDFLRLPFGKDQSSLLTFPAMQSKIRALPSTEDAGVGFGGATRVWMDEFEYHRYDRQNYAEILPPILEGGQLVIGSTADKLKMDTLFKELYVAARHGDNNFYPIFFPYDVVPGRDENWYNDLYRVFKPFEVECRYPRNEDEALETVRSIAYFDKDIIKQMLQAAQVEIADDISSKHKTVKIYKPPVIGQRYCIFTDPSDGKEDPHATVVEDYQTGEWVAISHGKVTADYCAQIHDELVRYYNNAFNCYELNARAGGIFSQKISELETPNQCSFIMPDGKLNRKKTGWWTGKKLKDNMEQGLEEAIRLWLIRIHYKPALQELMAYYRPEGQEPQPPRGGHDDFIIAGGGARQIRKYMPMGGIEITSFKYRES